ncbi:MAG: response regulator [Myxococcales bacterium]|nr:response regulator [Myxococcales bacterium]
MSLLVLTQGLRLVLAGAMIFIIAFLVWVRASSAQRAPQGGVSLTLLIGWLLLALLGVAGRFIQHSGHSTAAVLFGLRLCHTAFFLLIPCMTLAVHRLTGLPPRRFFVFVVVAASLFVVFTWASQLVISDELVTLHLLDGTAISGPKPAPLAPLVFPVVVLLIGYVGYLWRRGPRRTEPVERPVLTAFLALVAPAVINDALLYAGVMPSIEVFDSALALHAVAGALIALAYNARLHGRLEEAVEARTAQLLERETQLEHALAMRQQLLAAMPYAVLALEGERVSYANTNAHEFFGRQGQALVGTRLRELVLPEDRLRIDNEPRWDAPIEARFSCGERERIGELWQLEVPREHDDSSAPARRLVVIRDLTERRTLQRQLQVSERLAAIGTLAAGVAHEINNPLMYIRGNLSVLQEADKIIEPAKLPPALAELGEIVDECIEGADRIARIVSDLRSLSRVDDEMGVVDVRQPLEKAMRMTIARYGHRAHFSSELADNVPPVTAEEGRIGQVFLNLLVNAAQSLPEQLDGGDLGRVCIRCRGDDDGNVVIEIEDSGSGVPESLRSRIFEPFVTSKPVGEGTGLGLSICASIVRSLGGSLELLPAKPRGTLARVVLPGASDDDRLRSASRHVTDFSHELSTPSLRQRVLVVDDDKLLVAGLVRLLRDVYDVEAVDSGGEALQRIADEHFDAVVCDVMMPGISGVDVYERACVDGWQHKMVMITGGATTARASKLLEREEVIWLAKPVSRKQLMTAIEAALERGEALQG